jgi:CheY-like chemotaxis protein
MRWLLACSRLIAAMMTCTRTLLFTDLVASTELAVGLGGILEWHGIEVLAQASDATELVRLTAELRPDLAIVDVRMPPTHTIEGVDAAVNIRTTHPDTGVLLLSHDVEPAYAGGQAFEPAIAPNGSDITHD